VTTAKTDYLMAMGGAAAWAAWAMAHPKFWLGGPQCIWLHHWPACSLVKLV